MIRNLILALCLLAAAVPSWASASRSRSVRSAPRSVSQSAGRSSSLPARTGSSRSSVRSSSRSAPRVAHSSASRTSTRTAATPSGSSAKKCTTCTRTANGRIARSPVARSAFQSSHPCPATGKTSGACPGYVIDHITPLKRGGADAPSNMQWPAKAKDRVE
jgi:hypothetical protein